MIVTDTVQLALRNLGQAKLRTTLTTMGVAIGIASLAGMVSLGVGLQDQVVGRFMKSGLFDSITVLPAQAGRNIFGGRGGRAGGNPFGPTRPGQRTGAPTPATPDKPLDDDAITALAAIDGVKDVYPVLRIPVQLKFQQFDEGTVAAGVPMSSKDEGAFQTMTHGAFFTYDTDNACMLSLEMAKRISELDPKDLIGQEVTLSYATTSSTPSTTPATPAPGGGAAAALGAAMGVQRTDAKFKIVGIVERESGPNIGGGLVSSLMIPLGRAKSLNAQMPNVQALQGIRNGVFTPVPAPTTATRTYSTLTVKVAKAQTTQAVEDKIKAMGYSAFSIADALTAAKRIFILLDIMLSLIGSIALAVSSLGIVNTMVMSILERTREIGIMKALGGSDGDVRGIFLVEASSIGLLGGVVGVMLGWTVGRIINFGANWYIKSQGGTPGDLFSLPWWLIGGAIGFSLVISLIAGSYPASRAARLDPIQALRHD